MKGVKVHFELYYEIILHTAFYIVSEFAKKIHLRVIFFRWYDCSMCGVMFLVWYRKLALSTLHTSVEKGDGTELISILSNDMSKATDTKTKKNA